MSAQWRLFLLALRDFSRLPVPGPAAPGGYRSCSTARFLPLVGAIVGAIGGSVFWLCAQIWPTSVAVVLSMLAALLATGAMHETGLADACARLNEGRNGGTLRTFNDATRASAGGAIGLIFVLLIKYNALIALSAARLPFAVPANVALGLIMIAAHAASRAMIASLVAAPRAARADERPAAASGGELVFALLCGCAPAVLLGLPGLIGLASAIVVRIAFAGYPRNWRSAASHGYLGAAQQATELAFYLGMLGAWTFT